MKSIPFIHRIINRHYNHFDEDRKRNVTIIIILILMMIFVMGSWLIGFWILEMWEMFWLDVVLWSGFVAVYIGIVRFGMPYKLARFLGLSLTGLITAIPPIFYGMDAVIVIHLMFVPIATIVLFSRKERREYLIYLGGIMLVFLTVILWNLQFGPVFTVPTETFRIFNSIIVLDGMFISLYFSYFFFTESNKYKTMLVDEREKSDHLLLSIFPETIASQLRNSNQSVADSFENVTIIFADIVGFTQYSSTMGPAELVAMLDEVFSEFDSLVDKYGIEKIKTIGDAYMAVGGLPVPDEQHCHKVANMALEINEIIQVKFAKKYDLKLRIGIHTGKAVAGVIGNKKFSYDLWGDSVNIASRFEASGHPEKIHVTEDVRNILGDDYLFEDCGEIMIKGKGMMRSYFLTGKSIITELNTKKNGESVLAIAS